MDILSQTMHKLFMGQNIIEIVKICLLFCRNRLNIKLHHIYYCFNMALLLFTYKKLVYVNINIGIFLNVAPS